MVRRGRSSTWLLLGAVVVFTLVGAWFARNEESGRDDVLEPIGEVGDVTAQDASAVTSLTAVDRTAQRVALNESRTSGNVLASIPTIRIAGIVVDENGVGVPAARVGPSVPYEWILTRSDGSFDLHNVPVLEGSHLFAALDTYEPAEIDTPTFPTADVRLVLKSIPGQGIVRGVVVHPDGTLATSAQVLLGKLSQPTDLRGEFSFLIETALQDDDVLAAVEPGSQPAVLLRFGEVTHKARMRPPPARLKLGATPLAITGRVVDGDGRPLSGWVVELVDGTPLTSERTEFVESMSHPEIPEKTDDSGSFSLGELFDRNYTLRARPAHASTPIASQSVRAGTSGVELVVPNGALIPLLKGRVVDRSGTPMAGVDVLLAMMPPAHGLREMRYETASVDQAVVTDEDGAFELEQVPRERAIVIVLGDAAAWSQFDLAQFDLHTSLELKVARNCVVRMEGLAPDVPLFWSAIDTEGNVQPMFVRQPERGRIRVGDSVAYSAREDVRLKDRRDQRRQLAADVATEYLISEDAVDFEIYDTASIVVHKQSVHLVPSDSNVIRW